MASRFMQSQVLSKATHLRAVLLGQMGQERFHLS